MNRISFLLIISLLISSITSSIGAITPEQITQLNTAKKSFTSSIREYLACIKRDKDPAKQQVLQKK